PGTLSCGALGDSSSNLSTLSAGASISASMTFTAAANAGAHTLRVFADSSCGIVETNEGNNQSTISYVLTIASDLVVQSIALNKGAYNPNEAGSATLVIKNQGNASTEASFATTIYRNAGASISS